MEGVGVTARQAPTTRAGNQNTARGQRSRVRLDRRLDHYVQRGHRQVDGWLTLLAMHLVVQAAQAQDREGVHGPVGEIGVHHGKLFILLHLLNSADERAVGWDLFQRQDENLDNSGRGDLECFRNNVMRHCGSLQRVHAVTANSSELTAADLLRTLGRPARLLSIDGGHTAEQTMHDARIVQPCMTDGGIVILDDYFNEAWPGVGEGIARLLVSDPNFLVPVAIGGNKILMSTSTEHAATYRAHLSRSGLDHKTSRFFGHEVLIFTRSPSARRAAARRILRRATGASAIRAVRSTNPGRRIERLLDSLL